MLAQPSLIGFIIEFDPFKDRADKDLIGFHEGGFDRRFTDPELP